MQKITEADLLDYVSEVGEVGQSETEHRKYSSFYLTANHVIKEKDVKGLAEDGIDASDFLNVCITLTGIYGDSWRTEWDSGATYEKVEEYQELVPEVVIPEHYITKHKATPFKPNW